MSDVKLLLLDGEYSAKGFVKNWLSKNGFIAWEATDICHAMEVLSDFTVQRSPDVVLLSVDSIPDTYHSVRSELQMCDGPRSTSVLALTKETSASVDAPYFAADLNDLKSLIRQDSGSFARAA